MSATRHTDGTLWVACTAVSPQGARTVQVGGELARVYHPDAKRAGSTQNGANDFFACPNCGASWETDYGA